MAGMMTTSLPLFYKPGEVTQYTQPDLLALLWVKLAGKAGVGGDAGDEGGSLGCGGCNERFLLGVHIVRVDEVHIIPVGDPFQEGRVFFFLDNIPSHVRDIESVLWTESHNSPRKDIQTFLATELFALAEEELKTKTDA